MSDTTSGWQPVGEGPRVLVTGGARRLGAAVVEGLAADGARVALHCHRSDREAGTVVDRVANAGGTPPVVLVADLTDVGAASALPDRAAEALGGLDVVVNSAAVLRRQPLGTVTAEAWDAVVNLNLRACFFVAQAAAHHLQVSHGCLINVSDIAAFDPWPGYIPHCVSKAGVEMLTRALAAALAPEVRVNAIAPGAVLVPDAWSEERRARRAAQVPLGRLGNPEDVVRAVRYLMEATYTTGTTLIVDGGQANRPRDALGDETG